MGIYTILTWGLGAPLIYRFGYVGIAMAGLIITYLTLPFVVRALNNLVPVETWNSVKKPLLASLIMGLVTYAVNQVLTHSLLTLIATCLVGVVTYIIAIYLIDGDRLKAEFVTYANLIGKRNL